MIRIRVKWIFSRHCNNSYSGIQNKKKNGFGILICIRVNFNSSPKEILIFFKRVIIHNFHTRNFAHNLNHPTTWRSYQQCFWHLKKHKTTPKKTYVISVLCWHQDVFHDKCAINIYILFINHICIIYINNTHSCDYNLNSPACLCRFESQSPNRPFYIYMRAISIFNTHYKYQYTLKQPLIKGTHASQVNSIWVSVPKT